MASTIEKLLTPSTYVSSAKNMFTNVSGYYKPMFRSSSVTPLWHMMIFTSVVMYSQSYLTHRYKGVQANQAEVKNALAEYREKHGHSGHH
eukprot:CAMPEP_0178957878 /NCGR_PEP_ID=MMETSP0789-20121207/11207_1 /TAXON_ID=3005 /ORGANISM="Rhizosolenia setigera, Strain CCMP 1694" /LENGTH=89 /DNA_ID=CAMNT_0020640273 /DNA_START=49 /DNA_END=318 /DNA_ORIENTATION=+